MNIPTFAGLTAALSIAAVAGVIAWRWQGEERPAALVPVPDQGSGREALELELARLRDRLREMEAERREVAPTAPAQAAAAESVPEAAATIQPATAAIAFADERYTDVLAKIDWATIGRVTKEMQPLLVELVAAMEEGGEVSMELQLKIQELNSQLAAQVPTMMKSGLPGFGPNGSYTHPLFVANGLASTLAAAGHQLDAAQRAAIDGLVKAFGAENEAIVARTKDFDLEHLLAEAEMKDRFYSEVITRLTPEQQAQLFPKGTTEYDGINLFGTGLMTRPYAQPITAKNPADFARKASNRISDQLGLDEATTVQVRGLIESAAARAPELWSTPANATEKQLRMLRSGRTTTALRHQLEMLRSIQQQVTLTPEQRQKLAKMQQVLVPLPQ